jgi:hypothetical protein
MLTTFSFGQDTITNNLIPIDITEITVSKPNYAGGVSCYITFKNNSEKVIKYITFYVEAINGVNDVVKGEYNEYYVIKLGVTGPIYKKYNKKRNRANTHTMFWDCVWYNNTIKDANIIMFEIEYIDGEKYSSINFKDIPILPTPF